MFGIRGLLMVDGLAAIGAAVPLLLFLGWRATKSCIALDVPDSN